MPAWACRQLTALWSATGFRLAHWLLLASLLWPLAAAADDVSLAQSLRRAEALNLAADPYWHKLLHYPSGWPVERPRSSAVGADFLLAPVAEWSPQAELEATLGALFRPAKPAAPQDHHAMCRFPARARWLTERLELGPADLPSPRCQRFRQWYEALGADSATLVFASAYLNNPASMYGHTLLRLDPGAKADSGGLLSYAVNYAANTAETSGLVFAVKGLTGAYLGQFSVMPYYEKVNEYNDIEHRDLWEYKLSLTPGEVDRMVRHLWELRGVGFRYYFFLGNCSYRLLELLELARPGLELTDSFLFRAIPTDTLRAVLASEGMLRDVAYRPSEATVLEQRLGQLTPSERRRVERIARGDPPNLPSAMPAPRQARVLEAAYAVLHYRSQRAGGDSEADQERMHRLLVSRSRLPPLSAPSPPVPPRPDRGHATARGALAVGSERGDAYQALRLRPAYHDLLDPPAGYGPGQHIDFFDLELRRWSEDGRLRLERFDAVDITSIGSSQGLLSASSWNVHVSALRQPLADDQRPLVGELGTGYGPGLRLLPGGSLQLFAKVQGKAQVGPALDRGYRLGAGPRLGALAGWGPWRALLEGHSKWFLTEAVPSWSVTLHQRLAVGKRLGLGLRLERQRGPAGPGNRFEGSLHWYF